MNELEIRNLLNEFIVGQQEAMAAFTVAISQIIGKDQLAENLRIQLITLPERGRANQVREALLRAAWESIRPPLPGGD